MERTKRAITAALLALFAAYQVIGFLESRESAQGWFTQNVGDVFWPVNWAMFTRLSKTHTVMDFEGLIDGRWQALPMAQWYPARWESGYRWERPAVYAYRSLQVAFLAAACQHTDARYVRLVQRSWNKTLGQREQPRGEVREKLLREWDCELPGPRVTGKVY